MRLNQRLILKVMNGEWVNLERQTQKIAYPKLFFFILSSIIKAFASSSWNCAKTLDSVKVCWKSKQELLKARLCIMLLE